MSWIADFVANENRMEQHHTVTRMSLETLERAEDGVCDYERPDGSNYDLCLRKRDDDPCYRCAAVMELQRRRRVDLFNKAMRDAASARTPKRQSRGADADG